ncbi:hypothetical protein BDN70DRAFT_985795 [Pholiota conissans]|uniref:Uncharacterized protein n=1 Tax=Pholiota conissans TaxID=109636 RepID=A0A9P6CL55_9AGAR|nr:hypothetical protein BDN70DRAFT_985795 [Pholiota conissans]
MCPKQIYCNCTEYCLRNGATHPVSSCPAYLEATRCIRDSESEDEDGDEASLLGDSRDNVDGLHLPFHAPIRVLQCAKQNLVMTPIPLKLIGNQNDILLELIASAHYSDIDGVSTLKETRIVEEFISRLQDALLDQDGLEEEAREWLKNPITVPIDLETDPILHTGMNLFLDTTNAS